MLIDSNIGGSLAKKRRIIAILRYYFGGDALKIIVKLKRLTAVLMLIAFFLPMSHCAVEPTTTDSNVIEQKVAVTYAYSANEWPSLEAVATYGAFIWPLALIATGLLWRRAENKWVIPLLEILLSAGSAYILLMLTIFREPLYGWYIASISLGVYFIATLTELLDYAQKKWARRTKRAFYISRR